MPIYKKEDGWEHHFIILEGIDEILVGEEMFHEYIKGHFCKLVEKHIDKKLKVITHVCKI